MAALSLAALPSQVLVAVAGLLDAPTLVHWMCTARPFYNLLVDVLYRRDLVGDGNGNGNGNGNDQQRPQLSLRAGLAGNVAALQRALAVHPAPPLPPVLYADALAGDRPLEVVACLLAAGVTDRDTTKGTKSNFWPLLQTVLDAALRPPRWCPVPVVSLFFAHGYSLAGSSPSESPDTQRAVWNMVFSLVQVHGPRPRRRQNGSPDELRHDHCQHGNDACNVAMTRAMLQRGKARATGDSSTTAGLHLVARAMQDARRPVDLLRCLADAGADLNAPVPSASSASSSGKCTTPILAALEDALRLTSFAHIPRGRLWDCHPPHVAYPKAGDIVQFLLSRGVDGVTEEEVQDDQDDQDGQDGQDGQDNSRTLRLLDDWDVDWRRHQRRRPAARPRRMKKKGHKKQRLE